MIDSIYTPISPAQEYILGDWVLCVRTNSLYKKNNRESRVELEHRLVLLLLFFIDNPNQVLNRDVILSTIWKGKVVNYDSLAVAISHLRKALGDNSRAPQYIKTVPGVGYQFVAKAGVFDLADNKVQIEKTAYPSSNFRWSYKVIYICVLGAVITGGLWWFNKSSNVLSDTAISSLSSSMIHLSDKVKKQLLSDDPAQWLAAINHSRDLLKQYPDYAESYLHIAEAKTQLLGEDLANGNNCEEVVALLDKAISLDVNLVSAWIKRADLLFWCRQDYLAAEVNYRKAIELDPHNDHAPMQYAQLLLALGKFSESLAQVDRARQLNPLNYPVPMVVWIYQMQRRNDLAMQELTRIQRTESANRFLHISAYRVYARANKPQESFLHWRWLMQHQGYSDADLREVDDVFSQQQLPGVNRWLLAREELRDLGEYTPPLSFARYALAAGEPEQAISYLQQAFAARQLPLLWARVDPAYDPIRNDPRFQSMLEEFLRPAINQ